MELLKAFTIENSKYDVKKYTYDFKQAFCVLSKYPTMRDYSVIRPGV